jgi:ABC transport system ATP-binding/permease protein
MNYITVENLTKTYGLKTLFENLSLNVNEGDKIALIAKNGSGKSTLLKIISNLDSADSGKVVLHPDIQVVLFDQTVVFDQEYTVQEHIMSMELPAVMALKLYQKALETGDDKMMEEAISQMETHQAWDLENQMNQILSELKINKLDAPMKTLSGGQIKRVGLAKILLETKAQHRHQLLIMDEPTNHLDVEMIEWLEQYLNKAKLTLLLVTHDRYFLDSVCDKIWELEDQTIYFHEGAYAQYLENKAIRIDNMQSTVSKAQNLYRKELEWMRRQPKARTTKSKSRIDAFYDTEKTAKTDLDTDVLDLEFQMKRMGNKILELSNISKTYPNKKILENYSYNFQRGAKVGLVGKNGVGKTTFLNIIQGLEAMDSGKIETGETITFGYFSQKNIAFKEDQKVIEWIKDIAENFSTANGQTMGASQFLRLFLFEDQTQHTPIAKLSGGEKRRLQLISVLYQNPNFLIFDEPTNDLDLPTLTVLENFISQFQGCMLLVSHDRYFMDKLAESLIIFEGDAQTRNYVGTYTEYLEIQKKTPELLPTKIKAEMPTEPSTKASVDKNKRKLSYKEQREFEEIEQQMPSLEAKKQQIISQMEGETLYEKIEPLAAKIAKISSSLEEMELRWLELSELA